MHDEKTPYVDFLAVGSITKKYLRLEDLDQDFQNTAALTTSGQWRWECLDYRKQMLFYQAERIYVVYNKFKDYIIFNVILIVLVALKSNVQDFPRFLFSFHCSKLSIFFITILQKPSIF